MNHTSGPWKVTKTTTKGEFCWDYAIRSADDSYICKMGPCSPDDNAAFIVRAVNCHADLLAALEAVMSMERTQGVDDCTVDRILQQADAALAKAKGV